MIKFVHYRPFDKDGKPSNKGGATVAFVQDAQDPAVFAIAWCNPSDNFYRALGRTKAAGKLRSARLSESDYVDGTGATFLDHMDEFMAKTRSYYRRRKGVTVVTVDLSEVNVNSPAVSL